MFISPLNIHITDELIDHFNEVHFIRTHASLFVFRMRRIAENVLTSMVADHVRIYFSRPDVNRICN